MIIIKIYVISPTTTVKKDDVSAVGTLGLVRLPIAAIAYTLLEGYRVYALSNQRGVEVSELVSGSSILLRQIGIWAAILLTLGFELLIGSLPLLGLFAGAFL